MPIVTPTLHFKGQCEEAISMYKKAFDAKVTFLMRYADADSKDYNKQLTNVQKNMIYHSEILIGNQRLMLADEFDYDLTESVSEFMTITFDTDEEVKLAYELLVEEGTVIYPLRSTTYSSCMASIIDKFGFRWGLMTETT